MRSRRRSSSPAARQARVFFFFRARDLSATCPLSASPATTRGGCFSVPRARPRARSAHTDDRAAAAVRRERRASAPPHVGPHTSPPLPPARRSASLGSPEERVRLPVAPTISARARAPDPDADDDDESLHVGYSRLPATPLSIDDSRMMPATAPPVHASRLLLPLRCCSSRRRRCASACSRTATISCCFYRLPSVNTASPSG